MRDSLSRLFACFRSCKSGYAFGSSATASVPLTQRAFRRPAGRRVTFLLLAQKKSNPKKMAL
ncbi:hypothetical protein, partial [Dyella sp. EPa41]|uniref:hypothetical protein n=1 Tax=Dyella sp. EPa41 TaxID=1561194 RepID=UPI001F1CAA28